MLYARKDYEKVKQTTLKDKWEKNCPFCDIASQEENILWKWNFWYIQHNKYPLGGTSKHLLAIPYSCDRYTKDLSPQQWAEYKEVENFMYNFYQWDNYFSFIREVWEIKSIHHLHYHFLPGEMECGPLEKMLKNQWIKNDIC